MYDALTSTYSFACPHGRPARVRLSSFRALERLPGAAHPAVYRILFACWCGEQHPGLVDAYAQLYRDGSYVLRSYASDLAWRALPVLRRHGLHQPSSWRRPSRR